MNSSIKQKQIHRQRTDLWLPVGRKGRGMTEWEVGISRYKLLYIECISKKVLLCNTGNYIQYPVINHNGKERKGIYNTFIYIYITESFCCIAEINPTMSINYTAIR